MNSRVAKLLGSVAQKRDSEHLKHLVGKSTIAEVIVNGERVNALLDTGSQVNLITPEYAAAHNIPIHPLSDLSPGPLVLVGVGGGERTPLGYCVVRSQTPDVAGFNEEHPYLAVPDPSPLAKSCPLTWGTPILNRVINVIKESEIDRLSIPWAMTRTVTLLPNSDRRSHTPFGVSVASRQVTVDGVDRKVFLSSDIVLSPFGSHCTQGDVEGGIRTWNLSCHGRLPV